MSINITAKRQATFRQFAENPLDLLVIGGGIVGAGVARDVAMRGLRTGLVDRYDFAYGTSSRSSRLLHGGLRYLEQGRVCLVHESSVEKKIVHAIAPHLGQPLGFIFPVYKINGRPLWQMRIGVKMYDLLCNGRNFSPRSPAAPRRNRSCPPTRPRPTTASSRPPMARPP
jgi:glycerol-3-phosphate dehydrogenase